jgi:hypothetical protein
VGLAAPGLSGLATARHLIYAAADRLARDDREGASVGTLVTLSPVPGFARALLSCLHNSAEAGADLALPALKQDLVEQLLALQHEAGDAAVDSMMGISRPTSGFHGGAHAAVEAAAAATVRGGIEHGDGSQQSRRIAERVLLVLLMRWQHAAARSNRGKTSEEQQAAMSDAGISPASGMTPEALSVVRKVTTWACTWYLVHAGWSGEPGAWPHAACPVANFHSANGARLWRVNWQANLAPKGIVESFGIMVNYRYRPDKLEERAEEYAELLRLRRAASADREVCLPYDGDVGDVLRA